MLDIFEIIIIVLSLLIPVLVNKSTEDRGMDWIKPYLRHLWTAVFILLSYYYILRKPIVEEMAMRLHQQLDKSSSVWGYVICAVCGAMLLCAYWWFAGKVFTPVKNKQPKQPTAEEIAVEIIKKLQLPGLISQSKQPSTPMFSEKPKIETKKLDRIETTGQIWMVNSSQQPTYCLISNANKTNPANVFLDVPSSEDSVALPSQILGTIPPKTSILAVFTGNSASLAGGTQISLTALGANKRYLARLTLTQNPIDVTITCFRTDPVTGAKKEVPVLMNPSSP